MSKIKISFSTRLFNESDILSLLKHSSNKKLNKAIKLAFYQGLKLKDILLVIKIKRRTIQGNLSNLGRRVFNINITFEQLRHSCLIRLFSDGYSVEYIADYMGFSRTDKQDNRIKSAGWISPKLRFEVLLLGKFKCEYCKRNDVPIEVDHIIPISKGGKTIKSNLQVVCKKCNQGKNVSLL